jgi:hypothetical protein
VVTSSSDRCESLIVFSFATFSRQGGSSKDVHDGYKYRENNRGINVRFEFAAKELRQIVDRTSARKESLCVDCTGPFCLQKIVGHHLEVGKGGEGSPGGRR